LAGVTLRDRDGIVSTEGLVFRVLGYTHPATAYVCDAEYAESRIFKSKDPRAYRSQGSSVFYKFYDDEGWRFVQKKFPKYMVWHNPLQSMLVGVPHHLIHKVARPEETFRKLVQTEPKDSLLQAMQNVLEIATARSQLRLNSFGVFGSLLHGFYSPEHSDIDLVVYGKRNNTRLRGILNELYGEKNSLLHNEFDDPRVLDGKRWRFRNLTEEEFLKHQQRKLIYSIYDDRKHTGRMVKTEFEPVKEWNEVQNHYNPAQRINQKGWVKMLAKVEDDDGSSFIPSVYGIQPLKIIEGPKEAGEVERIISYMEEFRMQVFNDETVYVEGNLEEVLDNKRKIFQITLTYCPRYYEQALKISSDQAPNLFSNAD
jgi:predicted nucleotidyltransferase